jgi:hypothetical protein
MRRQLGARALAATLAGTAAATTGLVVATADASGRAAKDSERPHPHAVELHGKVVPHRDDDSGAGPQTFPAHTGKGRVHVIDLAGLPAFPAGGGPGGSGPASATGGAPAAAAPVGIGASGHAVTPRSGTGLPATGGHRVTPQVPDIVLIPPAALPAPAVPRPVAGAGFSLGPLIGLLVSVVMLGTLIGLRLARRSR